MGLHQLDHAYTALVTFVTVGELKLLSLARGPLSECGPDISGLPAITASCDGRNPAKEQSTNRLGDG